MAIRGEILSLDALIYSKKPISPMRDAPASIRFLNRLSKLLSKDKKMAEWGIVIDVKKDNTY